MDAYYPMAMAIESYIQSPSLAFPLDKYPQFGTGQLELEGQLSWAFFLHLVFII